MSKRTMNIMTLNVRGLHNRTKRHNIFQWIKDNKCDIALLQETYCTEKLSCIIQNEWDGVNIHNTTTSSHSRGVSILFSNCLSVSVKDKHADEKGRKLLINVDIGDTSYCIVNLYAPNGEMDRKCFFKRATTWIRQYCKNEQNLIICGDLNCCVGNSDRTPQTHLNDKSRNCMTTLMTEIKVDDVWRRTHPTIPGYTYIDKRTKTKSRLDYILISKNSDIVLKSIKLLTPINTHHGDHKGVLVKLLSRSNSRGKGYWKFNSEILKDVAYCEGLSNIIKTTTEENNRMLSKRLLWELVKHNIKHYTIHACVRRANKNKLRRIELQNDIDELAVEIERHWDDDKVRKKLEKSRILEQLYIEQTNGAYVRSRVKWIEKDERSLGFFQRMEKSHQNFNSIKSLKSNDKVVTDDIEILDTAKAFYQRLYQTNNVDLMNIQNYLAGVNPTTLTAEQNDILEHDITPDDLDEVIHNLKCNKSPGLDGLTAEFYKHFWPALKMCFIDMMHETFRLGELPQSTKMAVMSLIFKKGDRQQMKNYRPISLTNCDYKIITFALSEKLKSCLDCIIDKDQCGYIKGRYIGNSIRLIKDIYEWAETFNKNGAIICCDFAKAFDSIEWNFMENVLTKFGFKDKFMRWVKIIYTDPEFVIKNNGWLSSKIQMSRGIRQGCPLSALLFLLCVEIMAIILRESKDIVGFTFDGREFKVTQYADDTTLTLTNLDSITHAINVITEFGRLSGLLLNKDKCEGLLLGGLKNNFNEYEGIKFTNNPIRCLGLYIGHDAIKCNELNWVPKLKRIERQTEIWKTRNLTMFGKVTLIKTLLIPQLIYNMTVLNVEDNVIKQIESLLYGFLWKTRDRIRRTTVIGKVKNGGFGMIDIHAKIASLKASWVKRLTNTECRNRKILNTYLQYYNIDFEYVLKGYYISLKDISSIKIPKFYKNIILSFHKAKVRPNINVKNTLLDQPLWLNVSLWKKSFVPICLNWSRSNILYVSDCINVLGHFFSEQECINKLLNSANWIMEYLSIKKMVKSLVKDLDVTVATFVNHNIFHGQIVTPDGLKQIDNMSPKMYYDIFVGYIFEKPIMQIKWEEIFKCKLNVCEWENVYSTKVVNIPDCKMAQFNLKLLHNIIVNRNLLCRWKKN